VVRNGHNRVPESRQSWTDKITNGRRRGRQADEEVLAIRARIRLDAATTSPRRARQFIVKTLDAWGRHALVDPAALLVSELVTNAVVHARTPVDVVVVRMDAGDRGPVRVEVRDLSDTTPRPAPLSLDSLSGRGLTLVAALASRWGVEPDAEGKRVWFELADRPAGRYRVALADRGEYT
jgi:hypothetical protein